MAVQIDVQQLNHYPQALSDEKLVCSIELILALKYKSPVMFENSSEGAGHCVVIVARHKFM